jgi:hypothetical protein
MKLTARFSRQRALAFVLVAAAMLLTVTGAFANTRTGEGGDLPYYARIEAGEILNDGEWAVIIFYRPTECVPDDFNLLDMMDYNAFACTPPTTDGFIVWAGEPWVSAPIQIRLHEADLVPVWFVKWDELQDAVEDGSLTMPDLKALPSLLVGAADEYSETLHPTGVVKVPMINFVAQGALQDGRSFYAHAILVVEKVWNVQINFK